MIQDVNDFRQSCTIGAHTSGFPVDNRRTKDDFPTLGAPTRQRVGVSRSITGIARKVCNVMCQYI